MNKTPILETRSIRLLNGKHFEPESVYQVTYRTLDGQGQISVPWSVLGVYERFREAVSHHEGREVRDAFYDDCPVEWLGDLGAAIEEGCIHG